MMHVVACLHCLMKDITHGSHLDCGAGHDDHHCGIEHLHLLDELQACLHEVQSHSVVDSYRKKAENSVSEFVACDENRHHIIPSPLGAKIKWIKMIRCSP